jgi:predicted transposase YbfD/YdcC
MPTREPEIDPTSPSVRLQDHFASLAGPRRRKVIHPLINIVSIAVCAVVAGADDLVAIALWARERRDWLAKFLDPSAGIPSHDRFNAIFRAVDAGAFEAGLLSWIAAPHERTAGQVVALDGKTLRGSLDRASGKAAIYMVSAWATANRLSLGQVIVGAKVNEITAIPELLRLLKLEGCLVTIDAMGCQAEFGPRTVPRVGWPPHGSSPPPVRAARVATTATSSCGSTGFAMCTWKPASIALTRSSGRANAVRAAAGSSFAESRSRTCRIKS